MRPVRFCIAPEIVTIVAHVVDDSVIDLPCSFFPQGLGIAMVSHRPTTNPIFV